MKKFSEAVLAPHKHMSKKASPYHAHSKGLVYTPSGKEEIRPIDTADAGYGGEAVSDAEGGEADAGRASKKAVSPMKMQTLVKKTNEGFDPSSADIAKELVAKHGKNVTKDHIRALEKDRDSNKGLDHDEIMKHVNKLQEETERERLMKLRSFAYKQKVKGLGADVHEPVSEEASPMIKPPKGGFDKKSDAHAHAEKHGGKVYKHTFTHSNGQQTVTYHVKEEAEQIDELKKSTLASYAKKAADEVSYHSFTAGTMSPKDPERLETDKKAMKRQRGVEKAIDKLAKEEVELDEMSPEARKNKMRTMGVNAAIQHPKKVDFAGGAIQMYRQAVKKLSSKEMSDVAKKLPKVNEEGYKLVAKTKDGETFTSKTHDTKAAAQQAHYKMAKGGGYKNIKLTKVDEQNDWNGPAEENDMAMTQLHFIKYAAEKIMAAIEVGTDMEEWYQNKLSKLHSDMESLYSYMQGTTRYHGSLGDPVSEGKMKDIATDKAEAERILGGPVKPKSSVVGGRGQPKNLRNLTTRLAARAMKAGGSVSEEVWDKPMPDSKKQGSLSPEQKAKAKARAERAGRSYPNMVDNIWASKQ